MHISRLKKFKNYEKSHPKEFEQISKNLRSPKVFNYYPWQYASVNFLISEYSSQSFVSNLGLTTGGRTVNERPYEFYTEYGADVDIQGAYGTVLKQLLFPIGRPSIFTETSNTKKITKLGNYMKFLEKNVTR